MEIVKFKNTNDAWAEENLIFENAKVKLSAIFPDADIQHVGSTAIPGTISKGDVDINIRTLQEDFLTIVEKLKELYEVNQPHNWNDSFASFKDDSQNIGIQVSVIGSSDDCFVIQRDYFKKHPEAVIKYNALKMKFEGKSMDDYQKEKDKFFEALL